MTRHRTFGPSSLALIATFAALVPAARAAPLPYNSHVRAVGTVNAPGGGGSADQEDTNKRSLSKSTILEDAFGNESFDSASIRLDDGVLTAATHACSGGNPFFGGSATAGGFGDFNQNYLLTSTTLAPGTLVPVHFQFASHANIIAAGTNLDFFQDAGSAGAHFRVDLSTFDFFPTTFHTEGGIVRGYGYPTVTSEIYSGDFNPEDHEGMFDLMLAVGKSIQLSVAADATAGSTAYGIGAIDADSQLALVWGFDVTGDAFLTTDDLIPMPPPPASNGTDGNAVLNTPPRPDTVPSPEPASFSLLACGGLALVLRRRRAG